jgi:putative tricarboxylic transport membrane protein
VSRAAQLAAPASLCAIGASGAYASWRYGVWDAGGPGPGLLPGLASLALCLFAAIAARESAPPAGEPTNPWRLAGYVLGLAAFAFLMGPLGALPAIVLLFAWVLGAVERWPLRRVLPISAAAAFFAWLVFDRLLQVPLPRGLFGDS